MEEYIKGNFKKLIFKSENGYVIGLLKVKEVGSQSLQEYCNHTIPFTGYFHELNEEDIYQFYGKMVEHEKYGKQFQVESYERLLPEEKDATIEFLCSGLFKGIGEKTAEKIVEYLGKDTLTIILENPSNLFLIPGVTKKQIDILHQTLVEYQASYQTIVSLNELGFSTKDSLLIYQKYKQKTNSILEENIYLFAEDLEEITFQKVDKIALKNKIEKDDIRRVQAAILYGLEEVCNLYGHSYLLEEEIASYTIRILENEIAVSRFQDALTNLEKEVKLIRREEKYYLTKMYEAEQNITKRCGYLMRLTDQQDKNLEKMLKKT